LNKIIVAVLAGIGLLVTLALLSVFSGTIVWLLWNSIVIAEFAVLPQLSWTFCVAATWISGIMLKSSASATSK